MASGYIINSDAKWFEIFKIEAQNNGWIVHFQISGKQPAKIVDTESYLFHRISKTNKILGCSQIEEIGRVTLNQAIKMFGIKKLGYRNHYDLINSARNWSTSTNTIIFYEKLKNLKICNLDLNTDLLNKFGIKFGNPPSNLPTVGKSLRQNDVINLLNYI